MMSAADIMGIITMSSLSVLILTVTGVVIWFAIDEFRNK